MPVLNCLFFLDLHEVPVVRDQEIVRVPRVTLLRADTVDRDRGAYNNNIKVRIENYYSISYKSCAGFASISSKLMVSSKSVRCSKITTTKNISTSLSYTLFPIPESVFGVFDLL